MKLNQKQRDVHKQLMESTEQAGRIQKRMAIAIQSFSLAVEDGDKVEMEKQRGLVHDNTDLLLDSLYSMHQLQQKALGTLPEGLRHVLTDLMNKMGKSGS